MEETIQPAKKGRGWPLGKPRGPRNASAMPPTFTDAPEPEAPIHVRIRLKNDADVIEFCCEERTIENGFHVFVYPSERNRYYTTRREFAISEIKEIEITAARGQVRIDVQPETIRTFAGLTSPAVTLPSPAVSRGPVIHSARRPTGPGASVIDQLETSNGPIKMNAMPTMSFGDEAPEGLLTGVPD